MAKRLNPRHQEMVRDKIQATQLIKRLTSHALGEIELTSTQVRAIEILLNKSVPNLQSIDMQADVDAGLTIELVSYLDEDQNTVN